MRASAVIGLVVALLLTACGERAPAPKRMQTVKLLADVPPPPPPKPEEKKPEPPKEDKAKPMPQAQPQPAPPDPQPQALRSDEAAGNGPGNGLVAGPVSNDYNGQQIGTGSGGTGGGDALALAAANTFATALTRALNEHLSRDRALRLADYRVRVLVWLSPRGTVQRVEIQDGTGDTQTDDLLRAAIGRFPGSATQPPERLPQPLRLQVANRMLG